MAYTMSDKRLLADLEKSTIPFGVVLEMLRKRNQGWKVSQILKWLKDEHNIIIHRIRVYQLLESDVEILERKTKLAEKYGYF
jgi:superfamily II helicase